MVQVFDFGKGKDFLISTRLYAIRMIYVCGPRYMKTVLQRTLDFNLNSNIQSEMAVAASYYTYNQKLMRRITLKK